LIGLLGVVVGCGGSSFEVGATDDSDTGGSTDTGTEGADTGSIDSTAADSEGPDTTPPPSDSGSLDGGMLDTGTIGFETGVVEVGPPVDTGSPDTGTIGFETGVVDAGPPIDSGPVCGPVGAGSTDIYVDAASSGGTGSFACPFKTIRQALAVSKNMGVIRTVHVAAGNYFESDLVNIGGDVTVVSEGGSSKITGGSSSNCSGISDKCVVRLEGPATLDGFVVDATGVAVGMVAGGGVSPSRLLNSTVKNATKTGLIATASVDVSAVHVDDNGDSNVWVRGGTFHVLPGANSFDRSKGKGGTVSGTFVPAAGILVFGSAILNFEGGTANDNQAGVQFDWGSGSSAKQSISGLTATGNRAWGVMAPHGQKLVQIRKSKLVKNVVGGLFLEYDSTTTNVFDLGTLADPGGTTYGGAVDKNTKVGIFICHSPSTVLAEGTSFSVCAPTQVSVPGCDTMPSSYADVGYTPSSGSVGPIVDTTCTVGP
jgi:hypothetical protein